MRKKIDTPIVNDVTTKKKYVSPEIEVINLDETPILLSGSNYKPGEGQSGAED